MKYRVKFFQCYEYDIEADNEDEAIENAEEEFKADMCSPIVNTVWDSMECWTIDENDNDDECIATGYM